MHHAEVYKLIGEFGVYQLCVVVAMATVYMYAIAAITIIFVGAEMPHWCRVDELVNLSFTQQKNIAIPYSKPGSSDYSSCQMYSLNYSVYSDEELLDWNRTLMIGEQTPVVDCTQWTYDQSTFVSTIVSEFNLVCDRNILNELVFTIQSFGNLLGAFGGGTVSDRFGRKSAIMIFIVVQCVGIAMSSAAPNYAVFVIGRLIIGIAMVATKIPAYVMVMETIGPSYRTVVSTCMHLSLSLNFILQPLLASSLRSYVPYQITALAPSIIFVAYTLFIPESLRWLLTNGKHKRAEKVLRHICDVNGTELPANFSSEDLHGPEGESQSPVRRANVIDLFRSPCLRYRTLIIILAWITASMTYFGLSLTTGSLSGDIYVNTLISGAVEIPSLIAAALLMNWPAVGRRFTLSGSLLVAGICNGLCVPMILLGYDSAVTTFSMMGKAAITMTASTVYTTASEVFPTEARNAGMGIVATIGAVGSMIAPYIGPPLATIWTPMPSVVFGALSTFAGLMCFFLPETVGRPLPDTILQAEQMHKTRKQQKMSPGIEVEQSADSKVSSLNDVNVYVVDTQNNAVTTDFKLTRL